MLLTRELKSIKESYIEVKSNKENQIKSDILEGLLMISTKWELKRSLSSKVTFMS